MRFVVQAPRPLVEGPLAPAWVQTVRRVEDLGFAGISLPDHLAGRLGDQLAPLPALAAAATVSSRLALMTTVLAADFRSPELLAREVATVDALSGGRVELGLGAGWLAPDYEVLGRSMDRPGIRLERLEATVATLRDHWSTGAPRPTQAGGPPVWLGGGARRALRLAGRVADGVNLALDNAAGADVPAAPVTAQLAERIGWVREGAGERFDGLRLGIRILAAAVSDDPAGAAAGFVDAIGLPVDQLLASPHTLIGPVGALEDRVHELAAEWGITTFVVSGSAAWSLAPLVERFGGP